MLILPPDIIESRSRLSQTVSINENDYLLNVHPYFGNLRLAELKPSNCSENLTKLSRAKSVQSAERAKIVLNHIVDFAIDNEALEYNPVKSAKTPLVPETDVEPLTDKELGLMRAAIWNKDLSRFEPKPDGTSHAGPLPDFQRPVLFELLTVTGMRIESALALRWCDQIDIDGKPALFVRGTMIEYKDEKGKWHHERQPWNKGGTVDRPEHLIVYIPNCLVELLKLATFYYCCL